MKIKFRLPSHVISVTEPAFLAAALACVAYLAFPPLWFEYVSMLLLAGLLPCYISIDTADRQYTEREAQAVKKIQKVGRLFLAKHRQPFVKNELEQFLGAELYERASRWYVVSNPPTPVKRCRIQPEKADQWVAAHSSELQVMARVTVQQIKCVSYKKFLERLRRVVHAFNQKLLELPEDKRDYVIILGQGGKRASNAWVLSLALPYLVKAPLDIIPTHRQHSSDKGLNTLTALLNKHAGLKQRFI